MHEKISNWLNDQYPWVQEAASRLLTKGSVDDTDIADFVEVIKTPIPSRKSPKPAPRSYPGLGAAGEGPVTLRLVSVGEIIGIDKLAPRQPLKFPDGNLTVIYGNNGSGKSGYARILKRACGKVGSPELKANVFLEEPPKGSCTISFESNGTEQSVKWAANSDPILDLQSVDIFDSASGRVYLESETDVSFSPPELAFLTDLAEIFKRVESALVAERAALPKALPQLPPSYQGTKAGKLFSSLKPDTKEEELSVLYPWTAEDEASLADLRVKKAVTNPAEEARKARAKKGQLESLRTKLLTARSAVTSIKCNETFDLVSTAVSARKTADEGTVALTQGALLDGVGSQTWKALWEAARAFSVAEVYPEKQFPNTQKGAKCVLCHQDLDGSSQKRLADFEGYVTGTLETIARQAEVSAKHRLESLPEPPSEDVLVTSCQAAGLTQEVTEQLKAAYSEIQAVVSLLRAVPLEERPEGIDLVECPLLAQLSTFSQSAEAAAQRLDEHAKTFDDAKTVSDIQELEAKKWTAGQKEAIGAEINRLSLIAQIDDWAKQTATTGLSRKAGELSEILITDAYVTRFNSELKKLGASRIQVELIKSRVHQGQVKHKIQLKGIRAHRAGDVLSEGEHRIVSLAAFLATVMAKPDKAPFVFDDPISSLDQEYEEKTIDRLIELSTDRQVIILTHRLSLLGILDDKAEPKITTIRHEVWGSGQPGEIPIFGKKPDRALKDLKNDRLGKARTALTTQGQDAYYPLAKAICSDIRILVERIVELVLLADVIQRHRRAVNTQGKIQNLAKISAADCALVDKFMSRYSKYEHSQSAEAPVELPTPDELTGDLDELISWLDEFKGRPVPSKT